MEATGSLLSTELGTSAKSTNKAANAEATHATQHTKPNDHDLDIEKMLQPTDPTNSTKNLDDRCKGIREDYITRSRAAPKTIVQKAEEKKPAIERQLEESEHKLEELLEFGEELVTNVRVANEKRELLRRHYECERNRLLKKDLEKESIESMARFNEIAAKWTELQEFKEPMALFEQLEEQKEKVAALMASKDNLIEQCQQEIERINAKYNADQMAQANDVRCLVERINRQIEVIRAAYKTHLAILEQTIDEERQTITLTEANKWREFYDEMMTCEKSKFDVAKEKKKFYAAEIARITAVKEELTANTRIRLEKEAEVLELELRKVRSTVLMNSEKLDYNYLVLQKRNEENSIMNNQQKRRIAKLNENIATLKHKITQNNQQHKTKLQQAMTDIQKLHSQISELDVKAQQFRANNKRKFDSVWEINFKELKELLTKIYEIDRILYEQQLAMPWVKPEGLDFSDINVSAQAAEQSEQSKQTQAFKKKKALTPKQAHTRDVNSAQPATALDKALVRNILRKIADRAGFLIEDKILKILEPYAENAQCIIRLDNIFLALHIDNEAAIATLTECFLPYSYCPNCTADSVPKEVMHEFYRRGRELNDLLSPTDEMSAGSEPTTTQAVAVTNGEGVPTAEAAQTETEQQKMAPTQLDTSLRSATCNQHYLVIEPVFVLTALNDFTKLQMQKHLQYKTSAEENELIANTIPFTDEQIKTFWNKFKDYFPQEKRKLWLTLEHGLNHYMAVLKQRTKLDEECAFLRRQNLELKHLLQKFKI